eukprot:TRINITY_DN17717_c0_g1_i1.p2 TRINITY_DN17717_c0_g1~~TRINITY_DN17717_c0_g1_i1.p2  ORF type:complete len:373 (+),score=70.92 TRINITY_DN17717_c0_g1_i1:93-1211(+)
MLSAVGPPSEFDPEGPPRNRYQQEGEKDASIPGNPDRMRQLFLEQVAEEGPSWPAPPPHTPLPQQPAYTAGGTAVLRVVQWNVNGLCGPDARSRQRPEEAAAVLAPLQADVSLLQEMPTGEPNADWPEPWRSTFSPADMDRFDAMLREQGSTVQLRTSCDNPAMLATRLDVVRDGGSQSLDEQHPHRGVLGVEHRAARIVDLRLRGPGDAAGPVLTAVATHLHHQDLVQSDGPGVRLCEVQELLRQWREQGADSRSLLSVIASDWNQARLGDYTAREWAVVTKGLHRIGQPEDDGVAAYMRGQGWRCAFDSPAQRNWAGDRAPPLTHWTGVSVDYPYYTAIEADRVRVRGVYIVPSPVSDHLPVVTDFEIDI